MDTSRFSFPDFTFVQVQDTNKHEIEIGTLKSGDQVFILTLLRPKALAHIVNFLVATIADAKGVSLWTFQRENFDGIGVLAMADKEAVIALVGRGKDGKVERVIPLSNLTAPTQIGVQKMVEMKMAAAEFLGRDYHFSELESKLLLMKRERARANLAAQDAERAQAKRAEAERRNLARIERLQKLVLRGRVTGYTADGKARYGIPVVGEEWTSLSNGAFAVRVTSYDDDTQTVGDLKEAFQVSKGGGRVPSKVFAVPVTAKRIMAAQTGPVAPQPVANALIEYQDDVFGVELYRSMDDIKAARAAGLNSGTFVAENKKDGDGNITVLRVHKEKVDTLGKFKPLA